MPETTRTTDSGDGLFSRFNTVTSLGFLALFVAASNGILFRRWDYPIFRMVAGGVWEYDKYNNFVSATRGLQYWLARALSDIDDFYLATTGSYLASVYLFILGAVFLARRLTGDKRAALLCGLLSASTLVFVDLGNIPYYAFGMSSTTQIVKNLLVFALAALFDRRPVTGLVALLACVVVAPYSALLISGPPMAALVPFLARHMSWKRFAGFAAVFFGFSGLVVVFSLAMGGSSFGYPDSITSDRMRQYYLLYLKQAKHRVSLFWRAGPAWQFAQAGLLAVLFACSTWVSKRRKELWLLNGVVILAVLEWLACSWLTRYEAGHYLARAQMMRSIYWLQVLYPVYFAVLVASYKKRALFVAYTLAAACLAVVLGWPMNFTGANVWFTLLPVVLAACGRALGKWPLPAAFFENLVLASFSVAALIVLQERIGGHMGQAVIGVLVFHLAVNIVLAFLRLDDPLKAAAPVALAVVAAGLLFFRFDWQTFRFPVKTSAEVETCISRWVNATPPGTRFLSDFYSDSWYYGCLRPTMLCRYFPQNMFLSGHDIEKRQQIMEDLGIWRQIDFRWPEGMNEGEIYLKKAWVTLDTRRAVAIAKKYGIDYIVRDVRLPLALPVVYECDGMAIYRPPTDR